jgi:putative ABC transport system substrate-binding protein
MTSLAGGIAAPPVVGAQQTGKLYRLGYLSPGSPTSGEDPQSDRPPSRYRASIREQLRQYGWVEGRNLSIEYRFARGDHNRLPDLAAELIRLPVDVIYCETGTAAVAAVEATRVIPIVFTSGDPLAQGLTSSLARPDRNATGLTAVSVDITAKRLELLKEALPRISRVAVMRCLGSKTGDRLGDRDWQQTQHAAGLLRLTLLPLDIQSRADVEPAFARAKKQADALFVPDCALFNALGPGVMSQSRIPAMYALNHFAEAG